MNVFSQPLASLQILYNSHAETFVLPHNDPKHLPHMLAACQKGLIVQDLVQLPSHMAPWPETQQKFPTFLFPLDSNLMTHANSSAPACPVTKAARCKGKGKEQTRALQQQPTINHVRWHPHHALVAKLFPVGNQQLWYKQIP